MARGGGRQTHLIWSPQFVASNKPVARCDHLPQSASWPVRAEERVQGGRDKGGGVGRGPQEHRRQRRRRDVLVAILTFFLQKLEEEVAEELATRVPQQTWKELLD